MGDFASVNFFGLDPGTLVSAAIELDDLGYGEVEIYRVRVGDDATPAIPEPTAGLLFASGLLLVFAFHRTGAPAKS